MRAQIDVSVRPARDTSWPNFIRHFLEMIVAMIVGMAVLGGALSLLFALLGHQNLTHYAGPRALIMTTNMVIGMSLWMHYRRHNTRDIQEMAGAMFLPFIFLIVPYWFGLLSASAFLATMHALMFPFMIAVMLRRWDVYACGHESHATAERSHSAHAH